MKPRVVYIVTAGAAHEGFDVFEVRSTLAGAMYAAKRLVATWKDTSGTWRDVTPLIGGGTAIARWASRSDVVQIERWKIEGTSRISP